MKKIDNDKKILIDQIKDILGKDIDTYRLKKFNKNEFFYDYLKKEIKNKRKMGHLTTIELSLIHI